MSACVLAPAAAPRIIGAMRWITALLLTATLAWAGNVQFVRVWPGWRDAASFKRITEYFGGKEDTGGQTMLRTQAGDRSGFYFLVRTRSAASAPTPVHFVLSVILPSAPATHAYTFNTVLPSGSHVFNLGLTGPDWPGPKVHPVAWQVRLLTADGRELTEQASFLWGEPSAR